MARRIGDVIFGGATGLLTANFKSKVDRRRPIITLATLAGFCTLAHAQFDSIDYVDKTRKLQNMRGTIDQESGRHPRQAAERRHDHPRGDIVQITYASTQVGRRLPRPFAKEVRALVPAPAEERKTLLDEALEGFKANLAKLEKPWAKRYVEFKIAEVLAHQGKTDAAIAALNDYKTKHANSWKILAALSSWRSCKKRRATPRRPAGPTTGRSARGCPAGDEAGE